MTSVRSQGFLENIQAIRDRARMHIEHGAVTEAYGADRQSVIKLLNEALATELVCLLRYKRHYHMASGIHAQSVAAEFAQHAMEEQQHADQIAERIVQLKGEPDFDPEGLAGRSASEYAEGGTLTEMIREDLIAERVAIETYTEMVHYVKDGDPTTHKLLVDILAIEENHADELSNLLAKMDDQRPLG